MSRAPYEDVPPGFDVIWLRDSAGRSGTADKPPLSREQIVAAAVELADEGGLEAASVRRIAGRLGVGATSLYWHVRNKADLYELMYDSVLGEPGDLPEPTGDWRADLRAAGIATRKLFSKHPWMILTGIQPGIGPNLRRYGAWLLRALAPLGLDPRGRTEVIAILNNYLMGFAHRETAWDQNRQRAGLTEAEWEQRLGQYLVHARATDPELAAEIESRLHLTSDHSFLLGLDCVLDGITVRFAPPQ